MIRVSGNEGRRLISRVFSRHSELRPRRLTLGHLLNCAGEKLDQVMVAWFPAPHSYTGEEMYEISCHGSPLLESRILESLLELGARTAEPGEFTLRAFLNGKMDLAQAEAVRDLVASQTKFQARVARLQLEGALSKRLAGCKELLVHVVCQLETRLEFVEDEVDPEGPDALLGQLQEASSRLSRMAEHFRLGRKLSEGVQVAVVGKPNAGKSSLFNALLREDRAIVTPVPGTTRDAVSEALDLEGLSARLIDTAGLREAQDEVELLGVERTRRLLGEVDAVVFVVDGSEAFGSSDYEVWRMIRAVPVVVAVNKQDLPQAVEVPREVREGCAAMVAVAAIDGRGIESLRKALYGACAGEEGVEEESLLVTSLRHQRCVVDAQEAIGCAQSAISEGLSEEFVVADLRRALASLGEITGETTVEDILGRIFSTFCIGK